MPNDLKSLQRQFRLYVKLIKDLVAARRCGLDTTKLAQRLHAASLLYDPGMQFIRGKKVKDRFKDAVPVDGWPDTGMMAMRLESTGDDILDSLSRCCRWTDQIVTPLCTPIGQVPTGADAQLLGIADEIERTLGITARHSRDFRSVEWCGIKYSFTPTQATIVKELWEAYFNGTPDLGDAYLQELADSKGARLRDLFKSHPAWGTMITKGSTPGTRRLKIT